MALTHTLLALLIKHPQSGYDISKSFDEELSCYWKATQQQVYRELSKMETQGLVIYEMQPQQGKPDKKIYQITEKGLAELMHWYAEPTKRTRIREDLLVKVLIGHQMPMDLLRNEINHRKKVHQEQLDKYLAIEAEHFEIEDPSPEVQFKYLTLKRGIAYERSWSAWCDEVLAFLETDTSCTIQQK